ncbi:DNA-binding NarL/FixJ family response regulator [Nocardia sp. GAS34]|uniref:ATP-binding protein n=1 Tax=unclassified Nocardia TaxID=2637762 RepID=UPI003D25EFC2
MSSISPTSAQTDNPSLVGRTPEVLRIAAQIDRTLSGRGGFIIVEGEPGIGKTMLIEQAATMATVRGMRVLRGAAAELEERIPFAAMTSCLGKPPPGSAEPPEAEPAAVHAVVEMLSRWCADGPVVLLLDDIQWADDASLSVLRRLGELVDALPLMVMVTVRPFPVREGLPRLLEEFEARGAQRFVLDRLTDAEVGLLIERSIGAPPPAELAAVAAEAGGNPLYVIELVTGLLASGALTVDRADDRAASARLSAAGATELPARLIETVTQRLDGLPESAAHVLAVAAALIPQVETADLALVLGTSPAEVLTAVRAAQQAGLLTHQDGELTFRYGIVRRVFGRTVSSSVRTALLRHTATQLIARSASVVRIARYVYADLGPPSQWMIDWLVSSASALIALEPALAADLIGRSVTAPSVAMADRDRLRPHLIRALMRSGRSDAAALMLATAQAEAGSRAVDDELQTLAIQLNCVRGRWDLVLEDIREALARNELPPEVMRGYRCLAAAALFYLGRYDDARREAERVMELGAAAQDYLTVRSGKLVLGMLYYAEGQVDLALRESEQLIEAADSGFAVPEQWDMHVDAQLLRAFSLVDADRLAEADAAFENVVLRAGRSYGVYQAISLLTQARVHFLAGRWDAALDTAQECLKVPDSRGLDVSARGLIAVIAIMRGAAPADVVTDEISEKTGVRGYQQYRAWAIAFEHESRGDLHEALRVLMDALDTAAADPTSVTLSDLYPSVARLAMQTGDAQAAATIAARAEKMVAIQPTTGRQAVAWLCRGLAEGCADLVEQSVEAFTAAGRPAYAAEAQECLAVMLIGADRKDEAKAAGSAALERFAAVGAQWSVARAQARMRASGLRPGRRGPRRRPKSGWEALTVTEQRVAVQVAEGCSNAEIAEQMFLSRRTVQTHVSSILSKLGLHSRVHVAVAYAQRS